MNWDRELIRILRDRLAFLIPGEPGVKLLIEDAGLDPAYIDLSGAPVLRWEKVLTEAKKHHKIDSILAQAIARYSCDKMLAGISRGEYSITIGNDEIDSRRKVPISKNAQEDLARILELIDFRIVKKACRRSLHRRAHCHVLSIEGVDEVFELLLVKDPYRYDRKRRILEFAWRLSKDEQIDREIQWKLSDWFADHEFDFNAFESPPIDRKDSGNTPQPRLFIQVAPKHSEVNKFCVQAWLIPDRAWLISDSDVELVRKTYTDKEYFSLDFSYILSDYPQETHKSISPELLTKIEQISQSKLVQGVENNRREKSIQDLSFSKEELKELFGLFLNESLQILSYEHEEVNENNDLSELTIEVFLPPELLCDLDLDRWLFYDIGEKKSKVLGSSYRILIRSLERSKWLQKGNPSRSREYIDKKKAWKKQWKSVRKKCQEGGIPTELEFLLLNDTNDFGKDISDEKIGVKLVQEAGRDEILRVIINKKGIPIVLWTRSSDSEVDFESGLQELVHTKSLLDLPESVRNLREKAQKSGCQNHLGSNLVLLWDDPNSLLPPEGALLK